MSEYHRPPLTILHDQRKPAVRCVGCGDEGHALKDCPDETAGRRIARGSTNTLASLDLNLPRVRFRALADLRCG